MPPKRRVIRHRPRGRKDVWIPSSRAQAQRDAGSELLKILVSMYASTKLTAQDLCIFETLRVSPPAPPETMSRRIDAFRNRAKEGRIDGSGWMYGRGNGDTEYGRDDEEDAGEEAKG
eukprot:9495328-Pyramimonas_sp.AAC.1